MRNIWIAVAAIAVVAGGAFALTRDTNKTNTSSNTTQTQTTGPDTANQAPPANSTDQNTATTIAYGNNGFSPANVTVKSGSKITVKNTSSREVDFDSDPHPTHTDDPE